MARKILSLGILSEICYLAFWVFRFHHFLAESPYDLLKNNYNFGLVLIILSIAFMFFYLASKDKSLLYVPLKLIFCFAVIFNLTLVCILPIASDDLLSYISDGRIVSQHKKNPYLVPLDVFKNSDVLYSKIKTVWSSDTSDYGPVFTMVAAGITLLGRNNFFLNILLFKVFFILLNLVTAWLVYKITKSKLALILYSWNPLILFEISLNGHNDILLIFFFVLSLYFLHSGLTLKNHLIAWVFLIFSIFSKYYAVVFVPFYLLFSLKTLIKQSDKCKYIFLSFLMGIFLTVLVFFPFWTTPDILRGPISLYGDRSINPSLGISVVEGLISIFSKGDTYVLAKGITTLIFWCIYFYLIYFLIKIKKPVFMIFLFILTMVFSALILLNLNLLKPQYLILGILLFSLRSNYYSLLATTVYAFLLYFSMR